MTDRAGGGLRAQVSAQYEAYPYPARDPRDERKRLVTGSPSHLDEVDHCVFAGARDWSRPFRALVAGGGTGDATVMLAQMLADRGTPGEVVQLDLSRASMAVAEARIRARGLAGVRFVQGSLLEAARLAPGPFDYIDCCGVLHHLEDPQAGLRALAGVLAPEGGIGLMLYGALGRAGVYEAQAVLRALAPPEEPPAERLAVAKRLLAALPATNGLRRNPFVGDHLHGGDAGIYDLLLHACDRAYRIGEIARLLEGAGLRLAALPEAARYAPESYIADPVLRRRLAGLDPLRRAGLAEELAGNITRHVVYAVPVARPDPVTAAPDGPDWIPLFRDGDGAAIVQAARAGRIEASTDGYRFAFPLGPRAPAILARVDGRRTLGQIHAELAGLDPAFDWPAFEAAFGEAFRALNGLGKLLLRRPR